MYTQEELAVRGQLALDRLGNFAQRLEWQAWQFAQRRIDRGFKRLHAAGDIVESVSDAAAPIVGTVIGKTASRVDYCARYVRGRHGTKSKLAIR